MRQPVCVPARLKIIEAQPSRAPCSLDHAGDALLQALPGTASSYIAYSVRDESYCSFPAASRLRHHARQYPNVAKTPIMQTWQRSVCVVPMCSGKYGAHTGGRTRTHHADARGTMSGTFQIPPTPGYSSLRLSKCRPITSNDSSNPEDICIFHPFSVRL